VNVFDEFTDQDYGGSIFLPGGTSLACVFAPCCLYL